MRAPDDPSDTPLTRNRSAADDPLVRYSRHIRLPEVGLEGQERLRAASVLVIGAGGLGSPALQYLAAAGVGTIGVVDADIVELSNLQRQVVHDSNAIGEPKVRSAARRVSALNPHVLVREHEVRLCSENALEIVRAYDVIIDGSDNFPTRYLLSDVCVMLGKPLVYGSVLRFEGQVSVFVSGVAPCYRCLYPEPPLPGAVPDCEQAGVLGVLPGLIGTIQASEALKLILRVGRTLEGRLMLIDALSMEVREILVERDPECPSCGTRSITALGDYEAFCGVSGSAESPRLPRVESRPANGVDEILPEVLAERLANGAALELVDVREGWEWAIGHLDGARHVPLGSIDVIAEIFASDAEIVLYCHHGARSLAAAISLAEQGFTHVQNLSGGIDRWSRDVDQSLPRY